MLMEKKLNLSNVAGLRSCRNQGTWPCIGLLMMIGVGPCLIKCAGDPAWVMAHNNLLSRKAISRSILLLYT